MFAIGLFGAALPLAALPDHCPPNCDRIPASAWIDPVALPLAAAYAWPQLAPLAATVRNPRFRFEEVCSTPLVTGDPREFVVAADASVSQPAGQWQLQVQVLHWRGAAWRGAELADALVHSAAGDPWSCQLTAPWASPSITTEEPGRLAAVVSIAEPVPSVLHQYLVADPASGTLVELAMWSMTPPEVPWSVIADQQVFDALVEPLCVAYIGSCG